MKKFLTCNPTSPTPIIMTVITNLYMKVMELQGPRQLSFIIGQFSINRPLSLMRKGDPLWPNTKTLPIFSQSTLIQSVISPNKRYCISILINYLDYLSLLLLIYLFLYMCISICISYIYTLLLPLLLSLLLLLFSIIIIMVIIISFYYSTPFFYLFFHNPNSIPFSPLFLCIFLRPKPITYYH